MITKCPNCQKRFNAPDEYKNKNVKCPGCQQPFIAKPEAQIAKPNLSTPSTGTTVRPPKAIEQHKPQPPIVRRIEEKTFWGSVCDFFSFRSMIFPQLIKFGFGLYFIAALVMTIFIFIKSSEIENPLNRLFMIWTGLFLLRLIAEWLIIFFRINETLTEMRQHQKYNSEIAFRTDKKAIG